MSRVLVTGSTGMLGKAVVRALSQEGIAFHIWNGRIEHMPPPWGYSAVINCAGLVKQKLSSLSNILLVNGYAPNWMAEQCYLAGARLIHMSTDCVYSRGGPHSEHDLITDGVYEDVYALSKRAGEAFLDKYPQHLVIRGSFVGFGGTTGLLRQIEMKQTIRVSQWLRWSGNTVDQTALMITQALQAGASGLLHLPGQIQTRYQLVSALYHYFGYDLKKDIEIGRVIVDNDFKADRSLVSNRWVHEFNLPPPPLFIEQLSKMRREGA